MPGPTSSRTRAYFARVLAVLALVAGVAMMQSTPCETEFAWTAQCPTSSAAATFVADPVDGGSSLLDGILVAGCCLVVALAVLIGFAVLRRSSFAVRLMRLPSVLSPPSRRLEVRLAQLCVLRA
ncbi:hypothetical protein [Lentzea sp. NPDC060358]|uniref:hypothetical protein n=1 Tax=Lentzea sp. NPDC060358 TaxID=3347103 RepID=UPI00365F6648